MAQTQKMYLGGVPVIKNYFGENPIVSAGAAAQSYEPLVINFLIVAGGAGGGAGDGGGSRGGGGGAGRVVTGSLTMQAFETWNITVGARGNGGASSGLGGTNGIESTLIANGTTYTAPGGGAGGGGRNASQTVRNGKAGGSGGGAGACGLGQTATGGTAQSGTPISGAGTNGGSVSSGGNGADGGGVSYTWPFNGQTVGVAGISSNGANATAFGGGGNGTDASTAGNGFQGIVVLEYSGSTQLATGGISYTYNGNRIHYFGYDGQPASGSFTYPL